MKTHELKTWPEFFEELVRGDKRFELRNDDRGFAVGDQLLLREWNPQTKTYSGRKTRRFVSYILGHRPEASCAATFGLQPGYVILSVTELPTSTSQPDHSAGQRES